MHPNQYPHQFPHSQPPPQAPRRSGRNKWIAWGAGALAIVLGLLVGVVLTSKSSSRSECPDIVFIGAAGSGQRSAEKITINSGMGPFVDLTYKNLLSDANDVGKTIEKRPVEYLAAPISTVLTDVFKSSVETGAQAATRMINEAVKECRDSVIVAAGYSQGAMVLHRALHGIEPNKSVVGLLIADGDRIPTDQNMLFGGGAAALPGISYTETGVSLSGVGTARFFPAGWRGNLLSWCMKGDTVCANTPGKIDFDFGAGALIHTNGYDAETWRPWLKKKVLAG